MDSPASVPSRRSLPDHLSHVSKHCNECGRCVRDCAFLQKHGTPRSMARVFAEHDGDTRNLAFECSNCGLCRAVCPDGVDAAEFFMERRNDRKRSIAMASAASRSRASCRAARNALPMVTTRHVAAAIITAHHRSPDATRFSSTGFGPGGEGSARCPARFCIGTSKVRTPISGGAGASHGEAAIVALASRRPCRQRCSMVVRLNS